MIAIMQQELCFNVWVGKVWSLVQRVMVYQGWHFGDSKGQAVGFSGYGLCQKTVHVRTAETVLRGLSGFCGKSARVARTHEHVHIGRIREPYRNVQVLHGFARLRAYRA